MNFGFRRAAVLMFGLLVLGHFNNCGVYETGMSDANQFQMASLNCESEDDCVTKSNANLKVTPYPSSDFAVLPSQAAFNIGGDCNEAGFTNHQITWTLKLNNIVVRHSGMIIQGTSRHSACVNGKFRAYVYLKSLSANEDPVDRTGLLVGNGLNRASYDLQFEILALDSKGTLVRNVNQGGVRTIRLIPLSAE